MPNNICILCNTVGKPDVWNNLAVFTCSFCTLTWRAIFDLPNDHYHTIDVDDKPFKRHKRQKNTEDQLNGIKTFLPRSNICDIGAGDGTFLATLRTMGYQNCFGLEPGENGVKISKEKNLDVLRGELKDLRRLSKEKTIQAVTMFHVIEHLKDPKGAMRFIKEALPVNGILVVETPDSNAPIQYLTNHHNHLVFPEHVFYWNQKSLAKLFDQTGFCVVHVGNRSFDWRNTPIRNSLFRLGLRREAATTTTQRTDVDADIANYTKGKSGPSGVVRFVVRSVLAYIVHILGRDDYVIVVAKSATHV